MAREMFAMEEKKRESMRHENEKLIAEIKKLKGDGEREKQNVSPHVINLPMAIFNIKLCKYLGFLVCFNFQNIFFIVQT